jgi:hypothetical protein
MNGKCLFVAGGKFIEIEEWTDSGVQECLGQKVGREWIRAIELLNSWDLLDLEPGSVDSLGSNA